MIRTLFIIVTVALLAGFNVQAALGPGSSTNRLYHTYTSDADANWIEVSADRALGEMRISSGKAGATKPALPLVLSGNNTALHLIVNTNGNVGIWTNNPSFRLGVHGSIQASSNVSSRQQIYVFPVVGYTGKSFDVINTNSFSVIEVSNGIFRANNIIGEIAIYVRTNGSVGIKTNSPSSEFSVSGSIYAADDIVAGHAVYNTSNIITGGLFVESPAVAIMGGGIQIPGFDAGVGYAWVCTNLTTGEGHWTNLVNWIPALSNWFEGSFNIGTLAPNDVLYWNGFTWTNIQMAATAAGAYILSNNGIGLNTTITNGTNVGVFTMLGDGAAQSELDLFELTNNGNSFVSFVAPTAITTTTYLTIPENSSGLNKVVGTNEFSGDVAVVMPENAQVLTWSSNAMAWMASNAPAGTASAGTNFFSITVSNSIRQLSTNISVTSEDPIYLDLASYNIFKLKLLTNCNIVFSNNYEGLANGLVYFQQDSNGFRTLDTFGVVGGIVQTSSAASMVLTTNADALDLLEVKSGFFPTNLLVYWPKDFSPRIGFPESLSSNIGYISILNETYAVGEGDGSVTITAIRYSGSDGAASAVIQTADGTAVAGTDYTSNYTTLNWAAAESGAKTFAVTITDDGDVDPDETFDVNLSGITGAYNGTNLSTTVTITDNDVAMHQGQIAGISVQTNGWVAEVMIYQATTNGVYDFGFAGSSNNVLATTNFMLTVASPGYDLAGTSNAIARRVSGLSQLRYPYPDHANTNRVYTNANFTTVYVALSDWIGQADVITASVSTNWYDCGDYGNSATNGLAVTNLSSQPYGKVIANWSWVPFTVETNDTYTLRCVAYHRSATMVTDGQPVRVVKFWGRQGTVSNVVWVTNMSATTEMGDQNAVCEYVATMPQTDFVTGVVSNFFTAYPYVGNADSVSDCSTSGEDAYGMQARPFHIVSDVAQTYGRAFASVDPTNGTADGIVVTNISESLTNAAFLTIAQALSAISATNNVTFGRNDHGNSWVYLTNGTFNVTTGTVAAANYPAAWVTITPHPDITDSNDVVVWTNSYGTWVNALVKFKGLVYDMPQNNPLWNKGNVWWDGVKVADNGGASRRFGLTITNAWITRSMVGWVGITGWFPTDNGVRERQFWRGNIFTGTNKVCPHVFIGNKTDFASSYRLTVVNDNGNNARVEPFIIAYNSFYNQNSSGAACIEAGYSTNMFLGGAVVQNVCESTFGENELCKFGLNDVAAITNRAITNLLIWNNTFVGERVTDQYNDGEGFTNKNAFSVLSSWVGNVYDNYCTKHDTVGTVVGTACRTNRWPVLYSVGRFEECFGGWPPLFKPTDNNGFDGIGTLPLATTNNTDSFLWTDNGATPYRGGIGDSTRDYTPQAASVLFGLQKRIVIPYDIAGTARTNNGAVGAYE